MKEIIKEKIISCGIIFTKENHILMCHPTGHSENAWDLPKGCMEPNESYIGAAIRECYEETGFLCDPENLIDLGMNEYLEHKDLYLFKHIENHQFKAEEAYCNSEFLCPKLNHWLPEHDDFKYFTFEDAILIACPKLRPILNYHLNISK